MLKGIWLLGMGVLIMYAGPKHALSGLGTGIAYKILKGVFIGAGIFLMFAGIVSLFGFGN